MTLEFRPPCRMPEKGTDWYRLLMSFQSGARHTMKSGLLELDISALTQRANELERDYGWPIKRSWLTTPKGARVRVYWLGP